MTNKLEQITLEQEVERLQGVYGFLNGYIGRALTNLQKDIAKVREQFVGHKDVEELISNNMDDIRVTEN